MATQQASFLSSQEAFKRPTAMPIDAIRALIQTDLEAVDQLIAKQISSSSIPLINEISQHIIDGGGKRLRPMLVLLGAHAFLYQDKARAHIDLAAVVELIHTATLLHDDVVDASNLRRGRQTANAVWGNAVSVLVGDFLYSRTFQMMVAVQNMAVMDALSKATNTIAEGEVLQLLNRHNPKTTEAQYMEVVHYKTGTLFEVAAQLGALLCDCSKAEIEAMANYGRYLGIAFQLVDDAFDYCASRDEIGKNIGSDLAEGKLTLPLLYVLHQGDAKQKALITETIQQGGTEHLTDILAAIESTGAIEYTYKIAKQQIQQAIQHLTIIPKSPYRDALYGLAEFAVSRKN